MRLVNLTGHPLTLKAGNRIHRFPSQGRARIDAEYVVDDNLDVDFVGKIPVLVTENGETVSLPPPERGVVYVVSGLVAGKVRRPDVLSPARLHREEGKVLYAMALMRYL